MTIRNGTERTNVTQLIDQPLDSRQTGGRIWAPSCGRSGRRAPAGTRVWLGLAAVLALSSACSGVVGPVQETYQLCEEPFRINSVEVAIDHQFLSPDGVAHARRIGLSEMLRKPVENRRPGNKTLQ